MEIKVTTAEIIPFHKPMEKEIEIVKWVNQPNILLRNANANAYIESCAEKRKAKEDKYETLGYFVSGALVFLMPFAMYIFGTMF